MSAVAATVLASGSSPTSPQLPPVRVLIFDHTAALGGGEIAMADLIRHLDRRRIAPVALLASHGPLEDLLADNVPLELLLLDDSVSRASRYALGGESGSRSSAAISILKYVRRLARYLEEQRVEVIHTNSLKACLLGGVAGRLAGCRVVWHIRDRIAEDYLPPKAVRGVRALARILPHFVVANSRATLATIRLPASIPTAVIPSGVDLDRFQSGRSVDGPSRLPYSPGTPLLGLVGRICPWKGQHVFLKAAALVHQRFPNARFLLIGAALFGEHDYERELHEMVRDHQLEGVVDFLGFRSDVPALIPQLTILVHASVTGEPFGQVIVQGMACGRPVVATDGGGVPDSVVDGVTGLLVPMGDEHRMAAAMEQLLADPVAAEHMGHLGRLRVEERFTVQQTTQQMMNVYEQVADRRGGPA